MLSNLGQIWRYRYFWASLVKMDLWLRYRGSVLGIGWSLMNPIAMTAVFCLVFSSWQDRSDWRRDAPYFLAGLAIWDFVSNAIIQGCQVFFKNESFIRQSPLPMGIYPLRTVLGVAIHFAITMGVLLLAIAILMPGGSHVFNVVWYVIPGILLLFLFGWAVCLLAGFVNVFFQDTQHLAEVVLRLFFFLTPILFKEELLARKGVSWLGDYNPVVLFFNLIRGPLLSGEPPEWYLYRNACLLVLGFGLAAVLVTRWLEKKLIFRL